jgi:hypothetical protein
MDSTGHGYGKWHDASQQLTLISANKNPATAGFFKPDYLNQSDNIVQLSWTQKAMYYYMAFYL